MDNEHNFFLSMDIWMHIETVTKSWGPLLCHSSVAITSCFSMITCGSMSQGSVHNSWKLKMSQFFHGLHTHQTFHTLSMFGMFWIDRVSQFLHTVYSVTLHRHWRGVGQYSTGHNQQPDQLYAKEMCCGAWGKWWSHQIVTGFLIHNPTLRRYLWTTDAYLYSQSCDIHR